MRVYEKPVISVDAGMAEGVYAASGATGGITASELRVIADWGNGNGQASFSLDLTGVNRENLVINITFNLDITSIWGASSSGNCNGKVATISWNGQTASEYPELTVQANGNINQLKIVAISQQN